MPQGSLPFQYEVEKSESGFTSLAGLFLYLDLMDRIGFRESLDRHVRARADRSQGWSDFEMVSSLVLLNLAGGDCVDDLRVLEGDEGFRRVMDRVRYHGLSRPARRALQRRFRKERDRSVPSSSSVFRYLSKFHDARQEADRPEKGAFIPEPNAHLRGFRGVNAELAAFAQRQEPQTVATLDMDATLVESGKSQARYCYKKFPAYQPFNVWWAEQELVLHTEFRDGNVPAGYEQLRVFLEALDLLPEGVEAVRLRSDTAGYQHDLLRYCETGQHARFGRIEFAIGCDVSPSFKRAVSEVAASDWRPVYKRIDGTLEKTDREYAEVCFVPNEIAHGKKDPVYRYLATREVVRQPSLPGLEEGRCLPFPSLIMNGTQYKIHGVVTNMDWDGSELMDWLYGRCGKSEEAHSVMKEDLAGGKFPSGDFGENAAWWWIMILAFNLNSIMKRQVLGKEWAPKRMKAIRFHVIRLAGRVIEHARRLIVRLARNHPSTGWLLEARDRIAGLSPLPTG
jgi:hypothetical protein